MHVVQSASSEPAKAKASVVVVQACGVVASASAMLSVVVVGASMPAGR